MADSRNYSEATKSALFALSTKCYETDCQQPTVMIFGKDPKKNAQIAHIRAISPGGPRYNPPGLAAMTKEQRNAFPNLILLCEYHHGIVDKKSNESIYTVDLLIRWKRAAEKDIRSKVDGLDRLTEFRLNEMLEKSAKRTKEEITKAIGELGEFSEGAAELMRTLLERINSHFIDVDSIALLDSASRRLGYLEEGAHLIYSASQRLGDLESNAATLARAAEQLEGINGASWRLEQFATDYSGIMQSTPEVPDVAGEIDRAGRLVMAEIDRRVSAIDFGEPSTIIDDGQRWKYAVWGFVVGVLAVMVTVAILGANGTI